MELRKAAKTIENTAAIHIHYWPFIPKPSRQKFLQNFRHPSDLGGEYQVRYLSDLQMIKDKILASFA